MYKLAHFLRDKLPFIWYLADCLNSVLFSARYGGRMEGVPGILKEYSKSYEIIGMSMMNAGDLEQFFASQPKDSFRYFKPHGFDAKSLRKLQGNKALLAYVVRENGNPVGYFFLRSFFFGKAYLGKLVDHAHQGQGVGKMMCLCAMDIASALGLRMFETISRDNMASLQSTQNVLETRIVKEMPDNYLMIEDIRKKANVA